jgi:hypothetical protein
MPLGVVLPRQAPLAARTELALADLAGSGLVLAPRPSGPEVYDGLLAACRAQGFDPVRVRHAASPELVLGLVLAGEGVAFDSGAVARKEARVAWRPLRGPGLAWRLAVVWPAERPHPAAGPLAHAVADALADDGTGTGPGVRPHRSASAPFGPVEPAAGTSPPGSPPTAPRRDGPWTVVNAAFHADAGRPPPAPAGST